MVTDRHGINSLLNERYQNAFCIWRLKAFRRVCRKKTIIFAIKIRWVLGQVMKNMRGFCDRIASKWLLEEGQMDCIKIIDGAEIVLGLSI